jgi:glycyl-tRNA synthetase beta chain
VKVAFDKDGKPTAAALAFARKCDVEVAELGRNKTDKGEWLAFSAIERGQRAAALLPAAVESALAGLPIPRRMRWGAGDAEFVRPVHWVMLLHGNDVIDTTIMGVRSGKETRGHRFHSSGPIVIANAGAYLEALENDGRVIADFERRRSQVRDGVRAIGS